MEKNKIHKDETSVITHFDVEKKTWKSCSCIQIDWTWSTIVNFFTKATSNTDEIALADTGQV